MLDRHLGPFLSHLEIVRHLSPHTISSYKRDLDSFFTYLKEKHDSWEEVHDHHVRGFISQERRRGLSARSLQRSLSSIRSFLNYLLDEEIVETNPLKISAPQNLLNCCQRPWIQTLLRGF